MSNEPTNVEPLGEAVEAVAEILCAWDYRDDSGKTWPTLSDVGRDSFRAQAAQLLEGTMPGREQSAATLIRQQVREALESSEVRNRIAQAIAGHLTTDDDLQQDFCLEVARDVVKAAFSSQKFSASHFADRFKEDHWPR